MSDIADLQLFLLSPLRPRRRQAHAGPLSTLDLAFAEAVFISAAFVSASCSHDDEPPCRLLPPEARMTGKFFSGSTLAQRPEAPDRLFGAFHIETDHFNLVLGRIVVLDDSPIQHEADRSAPFPFSKF